MPRQPGVALIASRFSAPASPDAARGAIDDLYGAADRAKIINTNVTIVERADHYDPDRKEVVATQSVKADTTTVSRLVIAMDATHVTAALGECVIRDDAPAALAEACKAALVSLDPAIANRIAIVLPEAHVGILADKSDSRTISVDEIRNNQSVPSAPSARQPTMSDGSRMPMPPITVAAEPSSTDRRPIYVGGGLVVLSLIFWWNRRMRDKFERDKFEREPGANAAPARGETDADADDLHAAAKGDSDER